MPEPPGPPQPPRPQPPVPPPGAPEAPVASRPTEPAEARWEDVVDPSPLADAPAAPAAAPRAPAAPAADWPEPTAARRPAPVAAPPPAAPPLRPPAPAAAVAADDAPPAADVNGEVDDYDEEYEDEPVSRWVSLLATVGTALIGIVTIQVVASIVEGLTLKKGERVGVPDDILHRLGYPFGGLGSTALVFLVLGVVLVSLPAVLDELLPQTQDRVVGVALVLALAMGVIIAVGSLLAVRANLHEYAAKGVSVPAYVRVQFTNFLLGSLGAAALALYGSITAIQERARERVG